MENAPAHPKFVRWAVMLGIVIVLNLFFLAVRAVVLPEPQFEDYCPTTNQVVDTQETCTAQGGAWNVTPADSSMTTAVKPGPTGWCDVYHTCQPLFDEARTDYALYAFVTLVALGVLSIIVGVLPIGSSIVSSGLSYGGVLALIISATGYWHEATTLIQLLISTVALGALVFIGIRRFKD